MTKLLVVDAPHFYAGAVWQKDASGWHCTAEVAPIIRWMRGKSSVEVADYLKRKGWKHEWVNL